MANNCKTTISILVLIGIFSTILAIDHFSTIRMLETGPAMTKGNTVLMMLEECRVIYNEPCTILASPQSAVDSIFDYVEEN